MNASNCSSANQLRPANPASDIMVLNQGGLSAPSTAHAQQNNPRAKNAHLRNEKLPVGSRGSHTNNSSKGLNNMSQHNLQANHLTSGINHSIAGNQALSSSTSGRPNQSYFASYHQQTNGASNVLGYAEAPHG